MKKVLLVLGLAEKATEAQAEKAVKKLQADLEAQCKVGEEYSKFKPEAEQKMKDDAIEILMDDLKIGREKVEALEKKVAKLEKEVALGQIEDKEIKKLVDGAFKADKELKELWGTGDGHLFKLESQAKDHRIVIGGAIKRYTRD